MPRNGAQRRDSDSKKRTSRRSYLKLAGGALASVPVLASAGAGSAAAATTRRGIQFDDVVNMVEDAGCDPSGEEACDGNLQRAAGDDTLLVFPSGTYRFTDKNTFAGYDNFGIVGEGDVSFEVPSNYNRYLLAMRGGTNLLVENITVDQRASGATPGLVLGAEDGLQVHDVELVGQGIHPDSTLRGQGPSPTVKNAIAPIVSSPGGSGVVENFVAHNAGKMGAYTRVGIWVGDSHEGTLTLRNCTVSGFPNNGVYASRTTGSVQIEGGTFRNNDVSQIRIGSDGSYVAGATAEVDPGESNSAHPENMINGKGIVLEDGLGSGAGATISDCDLRFASDANVGSGISIWENYGAFTISDTRMETNSGLTYAVRAKDPDGGSNYNAPSGSVGGTIENLSLTGSAPNGAGMLIEGRPDSTIEGCCIQQDGPSRIGVLLEDSSGTAIRNSTINATEQPILLRGTNANVSGISHSGSCPAPSMSAGSAPSSVPTGNDSPSTEDGSESATETDDSDVSTAGGNPSPSSTYEDISTLDLPGIPSADGSPVASENTGENGSTDAETVVVSGEPASDIVSGYGIETDDSLAPGVAFDSDASMTDDGAVGEVANYQDSYQFEGETLSIAFPGHATVKVDENAKEVTVYGNDDGETSDYAIEVDGELERTASSEDGDVSLPSASRANGKVADWHDRFGYSGELRGVSIDGTTAVAFE